MTGPDEPTPRASTEHHADPEVGRGRTTSSLRWTNLAVLFFTYAVVGVVVGLLTVTLRQPTAEVLVLAPLMYSASAHLAAVGVLAAGGSRVAATVAGLLTSVRFGIIAISISARMGRRLAPRLLAGHLSVDPSVALAAAEPTDEACRSTYWRASITLFLGYQFGIALALVVGPRLGDPKVLGLDAVFPATMVAIVGAAIRRRPGLVAALVASALALGLTPLVGPGLGIMAGLLGVPVAVALAPVLEPTPETGR